MRSPLTMVSSLSLLLFLACSSLQMNSEDSSMANQIATSLQGDGLRRVQVTVRNRRALLDGTVNSQEELAVAQRDAERVDGIVEVQNHLKVRAVGDHTRASFPVDKTTG